MDHNGHGDRCSGSGTRRGPPGATAVGLRRLLQLRRGLPPRFPQRGCFQGPDRPSAVLAGESGLQRQAHCGDRQRRYGGHPGACTGQDSSPRDHAPTLAQLRGIAAAGGWPGPRHAEMAADARSPCAHPLEERPARFVLLPHRAQQTRHVQAASAAHGQDPGRPRAGHEAFHPLVQALGSTRLRGTRR